MPFDDSRMTTRSKKPPMSTITAGLRNAPAPAAAAAGRRWRVSGQRIPAQTTPTSSRRPQKLSHTWRIGQSQATKRIRMSSSTTSARVSNDSSQAIEPAVAPRRGARRMSAAAAVDALDARNSAPSHGLSAQIGRFVTVRRTPVYPATKKPSRPPTAATSLLKVPGEVEGQQRAGDDGAPECERVRGADDGTVFGSTEPFEGRRDEIRAAGEAADKEVGNDEPCPMRRRREEGVRHS